jgi:hypothetical protein
MLKYNSDSAKKTAKKLGVTLKEIKEIYPSGKITTTEVKKVSSMKFLFGMTKGIGMIGNPTPFQKM